MLEDSPDLSTTKESILMMLTTVHQQHQVLGRMGAPHR